MKPPASAYRNNPKNDRSKRDYLIYLKDARQRSPATVEQARHAIDRLEVYTGYKDFGSFNREQALGFKRALIATKGLRSGKPISTATAHHILQAIKEFLAWLKGRPGYRRRQPERALQSHVAWFLAIALPADAICLASAGGDRQRTQSPGYIAGTPDLAILHRGRAFFIELKAGKASRVAKAQAKCHLALLACGCPVAICRSLADVAEACETWSIPLRAGLTA